MIHKLKPLPTALALASLTMFNSVSQAEGVYALEEIIVTAQKRAQSLQEVPVAVTAISGDDINDAGITGLADISRQTPGFSMTQFNLAEPQMFIRGIGSTQDSAGSDAPVAMFIDEVYIGRAGGASMELYDIERIEVLRGPQGTLFGKNVVGGAISVHSAKPSDELMAKLGGTLGSDGLTSIKGLVNGALSDSVAGKFAFSKKDTDGYAQNITTGQSTHDVDNISTRGQLFIQASDTLDITLAADYSKDNNNGNCRVVGSLDLDSRPLVPLYQAAVNATTGGDIRECASDAVSYQERDVSGVLAKLEWDLPLGQLTSISAYRQSDYRWLDDLGGLPAAVLPLVVQDAAQEKAEQISQEIRFTSDLDGSVQFLAGYFHMRETVERGERFYSQVGSLDPTSPYGPNGPLGAAVYVGGDVEFLQDVESTSHAFFGQADFELTEDLSVTLGARWSYDKKRAIQTAIDHEGLGHAGVPLNLNAPYHGEASEDWEAFTPSFSVNYHINDDSFVYLTLAEGYKSGAFPGQSTNLEFALTPLAPEQATNLEVGAKTEWFDQRLRLNISAYKMDYKDLQVFSLRGFNLISDNAEATSQGLDVEFVAALTENLQISGSWSYLDAEYDQYFSGEEDYSGNQLPNAPSHSRNIALSYLQPLETGGEVEFALSYDYKSSFFFDPDNSILRKEDPVELFNGSVTWQSADQDWQVTAWGRNLGNEEYRAHSVVSGFAGTVDLYAPPRTYGLTVEHNFN